MKKKIKITKKKKGLLIFSAIPLSFLLLVSLFFFSFNLAYKNRAYPNISVANIKVAGKTSSQIESALSPIQIPQTITLTFENQTFSLLTSNLQVDYSPQDTAQQAVNWGKTEGPIKNISSLFSLLKKPRNLPLAISFDQEALKKQIDQISKELSNPPQDPQVTLENNKISIFPGSPGNEINTPSLTYQITQSLLFANSAQIKLPITNADPTLSQDQITLAKKRAQSLLNKSLILKHEDFQIIYNDSQIISLLNPKEGYFIPKINFLSQKVADSQNRPPQNPRFTFSQGKVTEFAPALDGIEVDQTTLTTQINLSLLALESSQEKQIELEIPVSLTSPTLQTSQVNSLGINEQIGKGVSYFRGSISSRIYNLTLASERINGTLVAPNETFSFNQTVGDISKETGFKEAYIIKDGQTILGDGGGVCQVSTTLFRAVLDAGLPVLERRAHAYRVGYYEQGFPPGLDATVYSPTTDLKFKNDTPGHILVQTQIIPSSSTLIFTLFGTNDGRVATTTKPILSEQTSPPDDIYQDDPTLPLGTTKQIEYKSWGAKVSFNYTVTKNQQTFYEKTFYSNYKPWAAVYLVGTAPIQ